MMFVFSPSRSQRKWLEAAALVLAPYLAQIVGKTAELVRKIVN